MSEAHKMGLTGSKGEGKASNEGNIINDESPERYEPYKDDRISKTYDTEALSIMDINDIIGVQTEPVGDSTLEGEMEALSAMITEEENPSGPGTEDNQNSSSDVATVNKSLQLIGEYISDDSQEIESEVGVLEKEPKVVYSCKPLVDKHEVLRTANPSRPSSASEPENPGGPSAADAEEMISSTAENETKIQEIQSDIVPEENDEFGVESEDLANLENSAAEKSAEVELELREEPEISRETDGIPEVEQTDAPEEIVEPEFEESNARSKENAEPEVPTETSKFEESEEKTVTIESEVISENTECEESSMETEEVVEPEKITQNIESEETNVDNEASKTEQVCSVAGPTSTSEIDPEELRLVEPGETEDLVDELTMAVDEMAPIIDETQVLEPESPKDTEDMESEEIRAMAAESPKDVEEMVEDGKEGRDTEEMETEESEILETHNEATEPELDGKIEEILSKDETTVHAETSQIIQHENEEIELASTELETKDEVSVPTSSERNAESSEISDTMEQDLTPSEIKLSNENRGVLEAMEEEAELASSEAETTEVAIEEEAALASELEPQNELAYNSAIIEQELDSVISVPETKTEDPKIPEATAEELEMVLPELATRKESSEFSEMTETQTRTPELSTVGQEVEMVSSELETQSEVPESQDIIDQEEELVASELEAEIKTSKIAESIEEEEVPSLALEMNVELSEPSKSTEQEEEVEPEASEVTEENLGQVLELETREEIEDLSELLEQEKSIPSKPEAEELSGVIEEVAEEEQEMVPSDGEAAEGAPQVPELAEETEPEVVVPEVETEECTDETEVSSPQVALASPESKSDLLPEEGLDLPEEAKSPESTTEMMEVEAAETTADQIENELPNATMPDYFEHAAATPELQESVDLVESLEMEESALELDLNLRISPEIPKTPESEIAEEKLEVSDEKLEVETLEEVPITPEVITEAIEADVDEVSEAKISEPEKEANSSVPQIVSHQDKLEELPGSEELPEKLSEDLSENVLVLGEELGDNLPEEFLEVLPGESSEAQPQEVPGKSPEASPLKISQEIPDELSEDLGDDEKYNLVLEDSDSSPCPSRAEVEKCDDADHSKQEERLNRGVQPRGNIAEEPLDLPEESLALSSNPEILELESAVKFLQESEEVESPMALSPKSSNPELSTEPINFPQSAICEDPGDLVSDLDIITDSIAISEAEIISEAAKLESERKQKEEAKVISQRTTIALNKVDPELEEESKVSSAKPHSLKSSTSLEIPEEKMEIEEEAVEATGKKTSILLEALREKRLGIPLKVSQHSRDAAGQSKSSSNLPTISVLEERLREPPQIEIPSAEPRIPDTPSTPKTSLLIQRDPKVNYHKMLDSPKSRDDLKHERREEKEKHEIENIGSPRIILKIAKSALAECGEPRSPKSPKIRSAANSPNPEDSPGQKLGKIRMKLSRSGHPSIIPNETLEERLEPSGSSLSPLGMKIKLSKSGDASIVQSDSGFEEKRSDLGMKIKLSKTGEGASIVEMKDLKDLHSPKRTDSPLGMKFKLSKTGDASIVQQFERSEDGDSKVDKCQISPDVQRRTDSPLGVKIKLSKSGDASIVPSEASIEAQEAKRTDSPLGMKLKISKKSGASIIESTCDKDKIDKAEKMDKLKILKKSGSSIVESATSEGKDKSEKLDKIDKLKILKKCGTSVVESSMSESKDKSDKLEKMDKLEVPEGPKRTESPLGMKIKLSKCGDASIIHEVIDNQEKHADICLGSPSEGSMSSIGMKIKLSKSGDATIIHPDDDSQVSDCRKTDSMVKIKLSKTIPEDDSTIAESKKTETPIVKIKLSKTGDPSIIQGPTMDEAKVLKPVESKPLIKVVDPKSLLKPGEPKSLLKPLETKSLLKSGEPKSLLKPVETKSLLKPMESKSLLKPLEVKPTLKLVDSKSLLKPVDSTGIESMKIKLSRKGHHPTIISSEPDVSNKNRDSVGMSFSSGQIHHSEVTIEPVKKFSDSLKRREAPPPLIDLKKVKLDNKLCRILPELTIQPLAKDPQTPTVSRQQMTVLNSEISITNVRSLDSFTIIEKECEEVEILEPHPELIIVNENSNSSQDVVIIDEVPAVIVPEVKIPRKRGRPRRVGPPPEPVAQDPLALDEPQRESDRPKRTCSRQKSYAPPKRGRGRGRGKRKIERSDYVSVKKARMEQNLALIEARTTALINFDDDRASDGTKSSMFKDTKDSASTYLSYLQIRPVKAPQEVRPIIQPDSDPMLNLDNDMDLILDEGPQSERIEQGEKMEDKNEKDGRDEQDDKIGKDDKDDKDDKEASGVQEQNWLTPTTKARSDISVQVIDEETRMSAESFSRSQTPARNIGAHAGETIINEESQGSVLSTATTESEKVKVRNRRMEINFDPDEGPFTVEKIAEYEWPADRKGDTYMIQEQISQYLGVKSFKRKYPDLKRRMVDMEERNHLRENSLVSESMCDMGLTAVGSSEVLDIMCSDFPEQYEEYRKHLREKQIKEHSKKQKELTAAATAEKNRIDLAEMAVQSALSWNVGLNKARKESRKCSLDLQTFTIHVPKKQQKVEERAINSHYPVALIPGQYTDYYREYTPAELRYYPLNTVLYGPMRPNVRKFDSQSEGSQSDSDSDSSSDDSSSSSSDGSRDSEGSQSTMDEVDMELAAQKDKGLKCKMCLKHLNKFGKSELLIQCGTCNGYVHPSCIDLTLDMVPHIQGYAWQCTDCKTCAQCHDPADEDKMLFCDMCDRGYHIYCVGLRRVPQGRWHCQECAICASCGSREPGGVNADRNGVAQWQHEYKKGDKNTRVYVSTLCVPCSKLWRKGRYCPHCSRCHTAPRLDLEENLVHCSACDKYLHLDCLESKDLIINRKNYQCDFCILARQHMGKSLVSKAFKS